MKRLLKPPGGDATAWSLVLLTCGIVFAAAAGLTGRLIPGLAGAALLPAGGGIWFRQRWGAWLGAVQILSLSVYGGILLVNNGFSWMPLMIVLFAPYCAWKIWNLEFVTEEFDVEDDPDEMMISLVALLPELPYFDSVILSRLAGNAWQTTVGTEDDENETAFVVGDAPHFFARCEDFFFAIHYVDSPHFDSPEEIADYAPESRIRQAILDHQAWISIDLLQAAGEQAGQIDKREAYRLIGSLLAELIDDDCLAIFCPEAGSIYAYHTSFQEKLSSPDPFGQLQEIEYPPVIEVEADDPRMKAAVEKARSHWPEFVSRFENRSSEQSFSVKAPLADGSEKEFLWINVTAIENNVIYGKLGNDPLNLPHFKLNDRVRVPVNELNDWIYTAGEDFHGGFTLEILSQAVEERTRRDHPRHS